MSEVTRSLRQLFGAVLKEAEENPGFAAKLAAALPQTAPSIRAPRKVAGRTHGRRKAGAFDPFAAYAEGEAALRRRLEQLDVERLRDIVAEHGMDAARLAMKWKSADRLVQLIIDSVSQRSSKGDAFRGSALRMANHAGGSKGMRRQVTCINKSQRYNPHERIQSIGGSGWKRTETQAISEIEAGNDSYYVSRGGANVDVIVATHMGRKYLKTRNDGVSPDNLLALPECP